MLKVLSTKLELEEMGRFAEMAERQGESKSGLLRRLVLDHLDGGGKTDTPPSTGTSNPPYSLKKDLLTHCEDLHNECLSPVYNQPETRIQKSTSVVDNGLPIREDVDHVWNLALLPAGREPVYRNAEPSKVVTSPKRSAGVGWLVIVGLIVWGLQLESTSAVDRADVPLRRKPLFGFYH